MTIRITPAPAGKTKAGESIKAGEKDHPRTCGENGMPRADCWCFGGSPPHLRGKRMN